MMSGRFHLRLESLLFARAQVATGIATAAEWLLVLLLDRLGLWYAAAAVVAAIVGGGIDFSLKRWWAFATGLVHPAPRQSLVGEAVRYGIVSGLSALWYGVAVWALVEQLHCTLPVAVVGGSVLVGVLWNYPLHRLFVFASPSPSRSE